MFFDKVTEWFTINDPDTWKHIVEIILKELQNKNT